MIVHMPDQRLQGHTAESPRAAGEHVHRLLESIWASTSLEEATAAGDADRALRILHEVSCNLLSLGPSSQTHAAGGKAATADEVPAPGHLGVGRVGWRVIRQDVETVLRGVALLEKQNKYSEAVHYLRIVLPNCATAWQWQHAALRISLDLERGLNNPSRALAAYGSLLARGRVTRTGIYPRADTSKVVTLPHELAAQRAVVRLQVPPRSWKKPRFSELTEAAEHTLSVPRDAAVDGRRGAWRFDGGATVLGVEEAVIHHFLTTELGRRGFQAAKWAAMHSENGIWLTIFGLLLWDIFWNANPGDGDCDDAGRSVTISHTDTSMPLLRGWIDDVAVTEAAAGVGGVDGASSSSDNTVVARLTAVAAGRGAAVLRATWAAHHGQLARGVDWERNTVEELCDVVDGVGPTATAAICRAYLSHYEQLCGGLPDLLFWGPDNCGSHRSLLVEVKGPGDKLSDNQRCWNAILAEGGAAVEVWYVKAK